MDNRYYVYRFKDKNDNILYVGRTHDLKQRFRQHEHLTDNIITIEYIECGTETEMAIKEIYYINLYYNNDSTNIRDVYDKPNDLGFNDNWIKYESDNIGKIKHRHKNKSKNKNINNINKVKKLNYEKIYVIRMNWYSEYGSVATYYTGGYDRNGLPNVSENPDDAKRYSSLESIRHLKSEFKKIIKELYPDIDDEEFDIIPEIYKDQEMTDYLFRYYHSDDNKKMKELFFEDQILDIEQGSCLFELMFSYNNYKDLLKILKDTGNNMSVNEYQSKLRKRLDEIEARRIEIRKEPEWEDPIWNEEFIKPYIKNNYDTDKALEELFENRKNGNKNFIFELHKCFLPEGYTDVN